MFKASNKDKDFDKDFEQVNAGWGMPLSYQ